MGRIRKKVLSDEESQRIKWYIAVYIRLSKDDGNDESTSVTNQRKIIKDYITEYFCDEDYEVVDFYIDDGETGTDTNRPSFQQMKHDIEHGKVNCVVIKSLARAFRNSADQGKFLEEFCPKHNVRFINSGDPFIDTFNSKRVGMHAKVYGIFNEEYAAQISDEIRRTFHMKRKNGEFIGAFAPYGYEKNPENKNHLIIDEEAAKVVRDIFTRFVIGDGSTEILVDEDGNEYEQLKGPISCEGIKAKLNDLGIPNPAAYKRQKGLNYNNPHCKNNDGLWMGTGVTKVLTNEMYIGNMIQGKQKVISYKVHDKIQTPEEEWYRVENTHEPIVSKELFAMAQEMKKRDTRCAPKAHHEYLFSGFLKCANCKKAMTRRASKGIVYYNCTTYKRKSKDKCTIHTMRLDILTKAVLAGVQTQIALIGNLTEIIDEINKAPIVENKSVRLETLLKLRIQDLEKTENIVTNLYVDWKNGDINREQYRKMKEQFESQVEQLKETITHIQDEVEVMGKGIKSDNPYLKHFLKYKNIGSLTQEILTQLIDTIYIHEGGDLTIKFRFEDQYKRIVDFINNNRYKLSVVENKAI